uniref:Calcium load-activated calcium channel n=1 Tax=Cyanoderma ruficeps TaxID=181631 RepID=A0A8C3NVI0_9PASS
MDGDTRAVAPKPVQVGLEQFHSHKLTQGRAAETGKASPPQTFLPATGIGSFRVAGALPGARRRYRLGGGSTMSTMFADTLLIVFISVCTALLAEGITWVLVYRTDKYKRLKAEVEKQSKKLEKKKETITESAGRQQKKKIGKTGASRMVES